MSPHSNSEAPAVFDSAPVPSLTSTTTTRAFEESDTRIGSLPCLVLMLVTFALFAKSIPFEFINFDDGPYVYGNTHVRSGLTWEGFTWAFTSLNGGVSYWHPITWLSHMADVELFGVAAPGHRLGNILLHTLNVGILFTLLRSLELSPARSWLITAFFAWHPLRVESVVWISERKDVLCAFFFLLSVRHYVAHLTAKKRLDLVITYGAFAMGAMSKPMIVTLPAVLVIIDAVLLFRSKRLILREVTKHIIESVYRKWPMFVIAGLVSATTVLGQWELGTLASLERTSWPERLAMMIFGYGHYVHRLFWPTSLNILHLCPDSWTLSMLVIPSLFFVSLAVSVCFLFRMDPFGAAGILIYCVTLLPVSGLVHVGGQVVADRYSYLPTVGILLTVSGIVLGNGVRIRRALCWAIGAAIPAMLVTTSFQIDHWRNSETLWRRALKFNPENPIARNNLGMFFLDKGSFRSAEREFRYAIACAPGEIRPHINLGDTLLRLKDFSGAEAAYRTGLSVNPRHALCRQGLGLALLEQGDWEHAAKHLKLALAGDNRLGYAYYGLSRIATTRKPDGPNATAEARIYAANACQLTRYQDPRLLAHYARTIARDGDFELAYKVGLAALRQIAGMKESEIGKDIEEVLDTCRSRRVAQPVAEGAKLNGQQFWETGSE